ncbi:unnamed protein product [Parnassius apollo]|uniref:(apollo) hypothetical protein n=1 Tax=Parnassius apollo TaxID=110799 RepID=A0A8S3W851_PARAO|nr:unnamed protein product [Parnassius apollo]
MFSKSEKINDLLRNGSLVTFSFEVTPDISEDELNKVDLHPIFYSITWHATVHQCKDLDIAPLRLASFLRQKEQHVLLHLSCNFMKREYLNDLMSWLQEKGICNLLIILGESFDPSVSDFHTSKEMIVYIREKTGDYFCIGVAGFPCSEYKISTLKEKVDSGADYIITQAFFESKIFKEFVKKCKDENINVPIIPGVFPFQSLAELNGFLKLCKVVVSDEFMQKVKNNPDNVSNIVELLLFELRTDLHVKHFHFFTINKLGITCDLIKKIKSFN